MSEQKPDILEQIGYLTYDAQEVAAQTVDELAAIGNMALGWMEWHGSKALGAGMRWLGLVPDRTTSVPDHIGELAMQRDIPNEHTSYFQAQDGQVYTGDGAPLLDRSDPVRIAKERAHLEAYVDGLAPREQRLIGNIFADPWSDAVDRRYVGGVTQVNTRRLREMENTCRVAVQIPARFEEDRIMATLEGFANQEGVSHDQYEVNVLVNHRWDETPDGTTQRVLEFMQAHPEMQINLVDVQFDNEHANVGYARKLLTDTIMARAVGREGYYSPLYIITADADETKVDPNIVAKVIHELDSDPTVDALRGHQNRQPALMAQNDLLMLHFAGAQVAEQIGRDEILRDPYRVGYNFSWNRRAITGGWACAFTAEGYAMIGGYPPAKMGEDMIIGELISLARGHWDESGNLVPFGDVTKPVNVLGESTFIRYAQELITGRSAYDEDQFMDPTIKQGSETTLLNHPELARFDRVCGHNAENVRRFSEVLQDKIMFLRFVVSDDEAIINKHGSELMHALGFKYGDYDWHWPGGQLSVRVQNWDHFAQAMEDNRQIHSVEYEQRFLNRG